ncbi:MAG TPA: His-Xaa-Ser system radical SAM maturase HxsB [Tepidisphaeraceae bacterium]|nr:His-Xaa-Ser system radical SAM maturase HxsB [Tepidisphaeraceae bacterium]
MRPLPVLNDRFRSLDHYRQRSGSLYGLLPMRFLPLDERRYVVTNFAGEFHVLAAEDLRRLVRHTLEMHSDLYEELKAKHFLVDGDSHVALELLATKYRSKLDFLSGFTSLFMFVVTLRCDHSCPYCQVSRQSQDRAAFDMTEAMADRAIDFMFRSPSRQLKVEFQGGESLLNFDLIRHIVLATEQRNATEGRDVVFVIATNLAPVTDEMLRFCADHDVLFSTSLDGPRDLHNRNRPRPGGDSYELAVSGISRVRESLGPHRVAALMTTTRESLARPEEIIDEYVRQGFDSIFLRALSPYGFAVKTGWIDRYGADEWLTFYRRALSHIIELNLQGVPFREEYAALILRKMLTPFATGYVDLQSPAGIGIGGIVFNYDGDVYASDESRMLAEMGDKTFRLGNVLHDAYEDVIGSPALIHTLRDTMLEGAPMCCDCGVQPYCGSDPVFHHATQGDALGFKPTSGFCRRNMGVIRHLITCLEDDARAAGVLRQWIR